MNARLRIVNVATFVGLSFTGTLAQAEDYPVRPIRIIMPWAAGGGTDVVARVLGERFRAAFGQSILVDNRTGAGGNIGHDILAKSTPDGYTLMVSTAAVAVNVSLYPKLPFNTSTDILPVSQIGSAPIVLTVNPSSPAHNVSELVALSKSKGALNFGSNGTGTASHLAGIMLNQMTGAQVVHIPYKGAAPAMTALLSGEIDIAFPAVNSVQAHVRSGKLRPLAVTTIRKSSALPDLPTLNSVYPGFDIDNWFMLFAPGATPKAIVERLHAEVVKSLQHPDMSAFMSREGAEAVGSSPAEAAAFLKREIAKFAKIVKAAGVKPDQ